MSEEETVPKLAYVRRGQQIKNLETEVRNLKARLKILKTSFPVLAGELEAFFAFDAGKEAAEIMTFQTKLRHYLK